MPNDHPCERLCAPLPRARMWKCVPGRFAAIRTIIVNVCGSRVRELTPTQSRLSIIVEGGNTCQQCRTTMGIPCSELRTISTLLAFVGFPPIHGGAMFSNVAVAHKFFFFFFFARGSAMSLFTNLLEITFVFSPFSSFPFSPRFLSLCARALFLSRYFLFLLSCYKICSNANGETRKIKFLRSRRENLICLYLGEVGVEKTIVCGALSFV